MKYITVATYNICHGCYAGYDWDRIASVIREVGADIVGFQEIDVGTGRTGGVDTVTELISATGMSYALFTPAMDYDGGQYGTAILSRYPITASGVIPLPSANYEPRAFGWVTLDLGEESTLTLLNTHLSVESRNQQEIQFAFLADWMAAHIPVETPAILTGDFNTEDLSMFAPITALGYAAVNGPDATYMTFRDPPSAIDNILHPPSLTPIANGMADADASDHNLLWCRFRMN